MRDNFQSDFVSATLAGTIATQFEPADTRPLAVEREPLIDCTGGFKFQFTVLGSQNKARSLAYAVDFYRLMPSPEVQGVVEDIIFFAPSVAVGSSTYADLLAHAKNPDKVKLISVVVTDGHTAEQKRGALIAAARHAPEVVFVENMADHSLIPRQVLTKFWQSGFSIAGSIVAEDEVHLFQQILPGLALPTWEIKWLIGDEDGRCKIQVHFEGKSVTESFVNWLRESFEI